MPTATLAVPVSDKLRDFLREKLANRETTQTKLAKIAGTDQGSISRFLREEQRLGLGPVDRLAAHFNLTLCEEGE